VQYNGIERTLPATARASLIPTNWNQGFFTNFYTGYNAPLSSIFLRTDAHFVSLECVISYAERTISPPAKTHSPRASYAVYRPEL
jgi:hypothetical protein